MKLTILAMYDKKANSYTPPIAAINYLVIARDLIEALNGTGPKNENWMKYPNDFELYQIGGFDTDSGEFIANENGKPIHLTNLGSLVQVVQ